MESKEQESLDEKIELFF